MYLRNRYFALGGATVMLASTLACKPPGSSTSPADPSTAALAHEASPPIEPQGPPVEFSSKGVPHTGAISLIALSPDASAALTRDSVGAVRLWAALDGSREPLVVPIRDPRSMAIAKDGAGGFTLSLVDAAGGVRIVGVDTHGKMQKLASLSPTDPITVTLVLPGGDRLLAVGADHVLRLLDRHGQELARLDQTGVRIASLRIAPKAEGGPRIVALTAGEFDNQEGRFAVEVLDLELGENTLGRGAMSQTLLLDSPPSADNPSLAPDGAAVVFVQRQRMGTTTWKVIAKQLDDGKQVSVDSQLPIGSQPRLALLEAGRVLLDDGTGLGRVVDLNHDKVELRALRSGPVLNHLASRFGPGLRVLPANNWLAVHDLATDKLIYLGYEPISVNDTGLSPTGDRVAWALNDRVAIEDHADGGPVFEVPETRAKTYRFIDFLDEEHLVMLTWNGGLELVNWRDGELVDAADLGNDVQFAEFARDGRGGGAMFVRTNLWQSPTLLELHAEKIGTRYLSHAPGGLAGLLIDQGSNVDGWGSWSVDGGGALLQSTFAQLRARPEVGALAKDAEFLKSGVPEQFSIGPDGTRYWTRTVNARLELHIEAEGREEDVLELSAGPVTSLRPSRDGQRIAVVQQRDPGQILTVYTREGIRPLWAHPLPVVTSLSWSDAGESLSLATGFGGGVVFDGELGSVRTARCGLAFEVRHAPPIAQNTSSQISVCEL